MHSVCKFVPSSKLSTVELDKVLTPDECLGPFSRARNTADILKQLPKSLADQLPLSAKRTPQSLTSALRAELVKGRWIAVSTFARKVPLTEAQLQAFPVLKAYMMPQIAPEKVKVHKASYQQVLDDVPLARNLTFVAPEPSPDDKIVVEFAGQWSGNAACLMLSKTEQQREKVTSARPDFEHAHRSLATFKDLEPEPKTLYINIPCQGQPQPILLKLAEGLMPVSQDTQMPEWDNVLIPVLPVIKQKNGMTLKDRGYIYIVWKNKVWRELVIQSNNYFSDVDLNYYRDQKPNMPRQNRHVNIDMSLVLSDGHYGGELFEIKQNGHVVCRSHLSESENQRVFGLIEEEVELVFPNLDQEPLILKTLASPVKIGENHQRKADGRPVPHIWVPYKIQGEVQETIFLHYSEHPLTNEQLADLEADPESVAIPLNDLNQYSASQSFSVSGDNIVSLAQPKAGESVQALLNVQQESNIAGVKLPKLGGLVIEYREEFGVDESDNFFELKNSEFEWSSRAYFRSAATNEQGNLMLRFAAPPPEIKQVDILRAAHSDHGRGVQHYVLVEANVPVSELIG